MSWQKQESDKPLFPDLLWSRPQNRQQAGKLLIIGGNSNGFASPAAAYASSLKAGVGAARVMLPEATKKALGKGFLEANFAPSTPSGTFSRQALAELLAAAEWADGVLLAGNFGRNSETAILLEAFLDKYQGQLTLAEDALDYFLEFGETMLNRDKTLLTISFVQLQKLSKANRPEPPIKSSMDLYSLVEVLSSWTKEIPAQIITHHADQIIVASNKLVSTTPMKERASWQVSAAAYASVWWLQQPEQTFEGLTSATYEYQKASE